MKIFRICPGTLGKHLSKFVKKNNANLLNFNDTIALYQRENILLPGSWLMEMSSHGFDVFECVYNDIHSQSKWAIENKVLLDAIGSEKDIFFYILLKQIEIEKPDIIYLYAGACILVPTKYRKIIKKYNPRIEFIAYWGDELPKSFDYKKDFEDTIINFTSSSIYTEKFINSGLSAITLGNCFEPSIKVNELAKVNDFVFCGTTGYGFPDHIGRYVLLKEIMKDPRLMVWGSEPSLWSWKLKSEFLGFFMDLTKIFPVDFVFKLLNLSKNHKLISLSRYIWASKVSGMSGRAVLSTRNDVYRIFANSKSLSSLYPGRVKKPITNGADYYGLVKSSRITLNIHRDEDADIGNIRCFEATGLGSCLITDHGKGMKEFFDIDNEIVTFESAEECIEKLNYLERYPIELEKIRERGQRRTLKDHTTKNRVDKIAEVIKNYYRGNNQSNKLILKKKRLIANYDLDRHPISYDFIFFLQAAYIKSQELEVNEVMVNINWPANLSDIPGLHGDAAKIFSDKIEIRIKNILLDVGALFPFTIINNIKNSILIENDDSVETYYFPEEKVHHNEYYRIVNKNPNKLYDVRATNNAVNYIKEYARKFSNKKIITLTLRSYKLDEIRNNNEKEWAKFLETLNKNKYKIIIIPDTDNIFHKDQTDLKIYDSFHPASFNFDIRLALYEIAYINFFVNNGPCVAATLDSKVNFLLFKIINPSVPHCTIEFLEDAGFKSFKNPEYLGNYQRYIWSDDSYEEINRAFKKLNHDMNV